ncbi:META domain-containing protein [Gluconobacter cerevisiae]|uniref:META domain-containing protein n=1 Tax=Gluconobacter cerevisiae TaxID=1379734 RepID=A0ABR9YBK0_9PROT|nr:META domain-containing protein [Gluconobacter cerevisiae]MBF0876014.1 META domain-containing protein [Gluconobacter cerevisiae]
MMITLRCFALNLLVAGCFLSSASVYAASPAANSAKNQADTMRTLQGQALYRERMALPPGAVLSVWIEDTGPTHGAPLVMAEQRSEIHHGVPIPYTLTYPALPPGGHYVLNAEITVEGRRLFATPDGGAPLDRPQLLLRRVAETVVRAPYGTWRIQSIGNLNFPNTPEAPGLTLQQDGTVYGTDGCNRLMGHFTLEAQTLRFQPLAMTRMACLPPLMAHGQQISAFLPTVMSWSREGENHLVLHGRGEGAAMILVPQDAQ